MIINILNTLTHDKAVRVVHVLYKALHMAKTGEQYDFNKDHNLNQDDRKVIQQITDKIQLKHNNGNIDSALKELNSFTDKLLKHSGADPERGKELLAHWS